jgi:hypothetical protein
MIGGSNPSSPAKEKWQPISNLFIMNVKKISLSFLLIATLVFVACGSDEPADGEGLDISYADKTLMDFIKGDVPENPDIMCFQSAPVMDSELEVTTYISGNKMRLEYMMVPPIQGQSDLYIVNDGEYMYMWGDSFFGDMMDGFKIAMGDDSGSFAVPEDEMSDWVDFEMPMTECVGWDADPSYFEVPDDMSFMDMSALESGDPAALNEMGLGSFGLDCSVCDMMPSQEEKDSCLEDLGC